MGSICSSCRTKGPRSWARLRLGWLALLHDRRNGIGSFGAESRVLCQFIEAARGGARVAVLDHQGQMRSERLARIGECLLQRVAGGNTARHIGKADRKS